jgi:Tfp pilus assembly protein PilX
MIKKENEQGAALIVALLILIVISLIGISAMKSSVFSAKVATATQADAMTFEAAETALSEVYRELSALPGEDLYSALVAGPIQRCVMETNDGMQKKSACAATDRMDSRGLLQVSSESKLNGYKPISGSQVSTSGGGVIFVDYEIAMLGESEMESFDLDNHHLQEALKRGIKPSSEIE